MWSTRITRFRAAPAPRQQRPYPTILSPSAEDRIRKGRRAGLCHVARTPALGRRRGSRRPSAGGRRRATPDDPQVLIYLAESYRNGGQAERAIPLYRRAIVLDPAQVTAPVGLGGICSNSEITRRPSGFGRRRWRKIPAST